MKSFLLLLLFEDEGLFTVILEVFFPFRLLLIVLSLHAVEVLNLELSTGVLFGKVIIDTFLEVALAD